LVQVYIEGFGSVEADNVATESTLQRIAGLLGSANNANSAQAQARLAGAANQAAAGLGTIQSATGNTNSSLNGLGAQAGVTSGRIAAFGKSTSAAASSMINSLERSVSSGTDSMSAAFSFMKQGGKTVAGFFNDIPILSGIATGMSAAFGMLLGVLQRTTTEFNNIQQSGAIFGGSMMEFRKVAHESGLTLTQLNNIFKANGAAMSLFAGSTKEGAKAFTGLSNQITKELSGEFLRMGVSFEQMGQRTADYLEQQALMGISVDRNTHENFQAAKQVAILTKQQKFMAAYNGTTLEQERTKAKQASQNINLQAVLLTQGKEQRVQTERSYKMIVAQFGKDSQAAKMYLEQQAGIVTKQSALYASQNQSIVNTVRRADELGKSTMNLDEAQAALAKFDQAQLPLQMREARSNAEMVKIGMAAGAAGNDAIQRSQADFNANTIRRAKAEGKTAEQIEQDMKNLGKPADAVTEGMIAIQTGAQKFQNALTTATTAILGTTGVGGTVGALAKLTLALGGGLQAVIGGKSGASAPAPAGTATVPGAEGELSTGTTGATTTVNGKPAVRVMPVGPNSGGVSPPMTQPLPPIPGAVSFNQTGDPGATPRVQQASFTPEDGSPLQQAVQQNFVDGDGQSQQPNSKLNAELLAALSEIARNTKNTADQSKRSADSANDLARQGLTA
jgi:hypothetical protein